MEDDSLDRKTTMQIRVAYNLIFDNMRDSLPQLMKETAPEDPIRSVDTAMSQSLRDETPFDIEAATNFRHVGSLSEPSAYLSSPPPTASSFLMSHLSGSASPSPMSGSGGPPAISVSGLWYLGIVSSRPPAFIMHAVYDALSRLRFSWKVCDAFRVRARRLEEDAANEERIVAKLDIQLYNVKKARYLVDFKNLASSNLQALHITSQLVVMIENSLDGGGPTDV